MKLKKIASFVTLVAALAVGTQAIQPREAHAVLLVELAAGGPAYINLPEIVLCVFLLPICLLDQKATPATAYSQQDLIDNGYSPSQIKVIEQDQVRIMTALQARGQRMVVEKTDNRASLAQGLRRIDPTVSDEYVGFVADMNHIQ
jgi:hypothetical protein